MTPKINLGTFGLVQAGKNVETKATFESKFLFMNKAFGKYKSVLICVFLAGATLAVYRRVLYNDFVNYDDPVYVTENKQVEAGLTREGVVWAFTSRRANNWHPLTWLSLMLDSELFGLKAGVFHATNLLIHIANTLLLFLVLRKMTGSLWCSGFVAAVFALHPLHVESVAWVSERKDVLSALFWLLTMWGYADYVQCGGRLRYLLTLLFFGLGLMAKPMLVSLPIVMLLLDYWPLSRLQTAKLSKAGLLQQNNISRRSALIYLLLEKVPFFVLAGASSLITVMVQKRGGAVIALERLSLSTRIFNALVTYIIYIVKTFFPRGLAVYYPHPHTLPIWQVAAAILLLGLITAAVLSAHRGYLTSGWLWYIVTLIPVIGLVQVGSQARADRYMYVPMVGVLIMLAWGVGEVTARWRLRRFVLSFVAGICLSASMVCTLQQVGYWRNSFTLFSRAIAVTSGNYIAHLNLGNFLTRQKRSKEAIPHYKKAIEIYRDYVEAHYNLGIALSLERRYDEAIEEYYTVLRLKGRHGEVEFRLADALSQKGRLDEAIIYYTKALERQPNDVEVLNNFALALFKKGEIKEAIKYYKKSLEIKPDSVEVLNNLGNALVKQKEFDEAVLLFKKALSLEPSFGATHYNLANALRQTGRIDEAILHYREAVRLRPNDIDAHYGLGLSLAELKRYDEAAIHYQKAIELNADFAQAHYNLGIIFVNRNEIDKAIEQFRQVLRIHPEDAEMHCNVGILLAQKGLLDEAVEEFRSALRFDPSLSKAREQLEAILKRKDISNSQ